MFIRKGRCVSSALLLILIGTLLSPGCLYSETEPDQVTLQINWYHEAEFASYYVAAAKGFYQDENIEITIEEGGIGISAYKRVLEGQADFAVATFYDQKKMLQADEPGITVMATFQIPPTVLFALADSGIQAPQDMVGRKVAVKASYWRSIIHDTLTNAGVDPSEIEEVEVDADVIEMLYNEEVDVWTGYAHDEPIMAELAGYEVSMIFPAYYGVGDYEGLLVVHQDTLDKDHDLVARFVRATLKGWQYAFEHADETAHILHEWNPDSSLEFHTRALRALIPLVDTPQDPIGWIDDERWQQGMGDLSSSEHPRYTIEFLE